MATTDLSKLMLDQYRPPLIWVDCPRRQCISRHASVDTSKLKAMFGNITLEMVARKVAMGKCPLASDDKTNVCGARCSEPPVERWAWLDHARRGGWKGVLVCHRKMAGGKASKSCEEETRLDLDTLIAALGYDFRLDRLPHQMRCPLCGTSSIDIRWVVPPDGPKPGGAAVSAPVLQLRPTGAEVGLRRFRVMKG